MNLPWWSRTTAPPPPQLASLGQERSAFTLCHPSVGGSQRSSWRSPFKEDVETLRFLHSSTRCKVLLAVACHSWYSIMSCSANSSSFRPPIRSSSQFDKTRWPCKECGACRSCNLEWSLRRSQSLAACGQDQNRWSNVSSLLHATHRTPSLICCRCSSEPTASPFFAKRHPCTSTLFSTWAAHKASHPLHADFTSCGWMS